MSPVVVLLVAYLAMAVASGDFYKISISVAFVVAAVYAVAALRGVSRSLQERVGVFSEGAADKNILYMIWIFILAGIFAASAKAMGAVDATVHFTLRFVPAEFLPAGIFVAACFVSLSIGTSVGTIVALTPVVTGLAQQMGADTAQMVAIVVGGAFFGDNLSFISDTTIAATMSQGCKMKDKFKENFFIALPAAVITIVILLIFAFTSTDVNAYTPATPNLWLLIPYVLVLVGGIVGINVFVVLLAGIGAAFIIKLCLGIEFIEIVGSMGSGANGMFEVILVTVLVTMLSGIMRHFGGFDALLHWVKRTFKGKVGGQLGIGALVSAMDIATANNTVAIVMAAPIAKNISEEYGITNTKTASILDIFGSVVQGIIPYGAQMIYAVSAITVAYAGGVIPSVVSAVQIIPFLFYPFLLAVSAVVFAFFPSFGSKKKTEELIKTEE